jgi:hypothetical protein
MNCVARSGLRTSSANATTGAANGTIVLFIFKKEWRQPISTAAGNFNSPS